MGRGWGRVQSGLEAIAWRHMDGSELIQIGATLGFRDRRSPRQDYPSRVSEQTPGRNKMSQEEGLGLRRVEMWLRSKLRLGKWLSG